MHDPWPWQRIMHTFSGYGETEPLGVKVAGGDVVNDAVNGAPAYDDRALPGGAEGEYQRDAQTYDQRESADDQRAAKAGAHGEYAGVRDQGGPAHRQRDHIEAGQFSRCRGEARTAIGRERVHLS